jgi:L-2-hydroxyglutarate oxidase
MAEKKIVIIGGGIIGLSTALVLTKRLPQYQVCVFEKEREVAPHQTGHNSGVIHSGIYYKPGSLKARFCVEGARHMLDFCKTHDIAHRITGKVVVATSPEELPRLEELYRRGVANGVGGVEKIGPQRLKEIEPHTTGIAALWVPGTGIVDYRAVCQKMMALVENQGGKIYLGTQVTAANQEGSSWWVQTTREHIECRFLVNCSGLHTDRTAKNCGSNPEEKIVPFRGEYYRLTSASERLVKGLIYPVPDPEFPFLGVHFTHFMAGGVEAGPNAVLAFKREGYKKTDVSLHDMWDTFSYPGFWKLSMKYPKTAFYESYRSWNRGAFVKALQKLVPEISDKDLQTGGSGVRAQALNSQGHLLDDFRFTEAPSALHVLNAPSPAATASLPIGKYIAEKVAGLIF